MIEVDGLEKAYGDLTAVQGLSFQVRPGEVVGLVGPNGAGKTTTLRCLAGITVPTAGRIRIAGHDRRVAGVKRGRRCRGEIIEAGHQGGDDQPGRRAGGGQAGAGVHPR